MPETEVETPAPPANEKIVSFDPLRYQRLLTLDPKKDARACECMRTLSTRAHTCAHMLNLR